MDTLNAQQIFSINVAKLILKIKELNYSITLGEAYRTAEQQKIYLMQGKSKTMFSKHCERLAIDLNIMDSQNIVISHEKMKQVAEYWESLNVNNVAGWSWGWDDNHFEMKHTPRPYTDVIIGVKESVSATK